MNERFPNSAEWPHIQERLDASLESVGENANTENGAHSNENANVAAENFAAENMASDNDNGESDNVKTARESESSTRNGGSNFGSAPENGFSGLGYGGDRDAQEILQEYREAARQNPESSRHQADLAEGYANADQPHKALRQYQRALQTQRDNDQEEMPDAHLGIGDLCRTFALSAAAVRSYERAVRLRPERPYYRWKLAVALAAMGLYEQSVAQMSKAIEIAPRDTYYRFQLADVYLLMNRDDDAIEELQRVVELSPRDDYYHLRLGAALIRNGQTQEATRYFERAVELQPQNASYRTLLRYALTRNGQAPAISFDVDMLALGSYDEDFVRRIQRLAGES